jgi:hypothetical protein
MAHPTTVPVASPAPGPFLCRQLMGWPNCFDLHGLLAKLHSQTSPEATWQLGDENYARVRAGMSGQSAGYIAVRRLVLPWCKVGALASIELLGA